MVPSAVASSKCVVAMPAATSAAPTPPSSRPPVTGFDANKVVITVGGIHKKDNDDWERRLSAGRRAFEDEAKLLLKQQAGASNHKSDAKNSSLRRSTARVVRTCDPDDGGSAKDESPSTRRLRKPVFSLVTCSKANVVATAQQQQQQRSAKEIIRKDSMADASVMSSYHPLEVDLDDDAIMV